MDWSSYPNFSRDEMKCRETGEEGMTPYFMQRLQHLRWLYGKPMLVTSGFRSPSHSVEVVKASPGEHCTGRAVDIAVQGVDALRLIQLALNMGFTRIGVQQKGSGRFIHLGDSPDFPSGIWSY